MNFWTWMLIFSGSLGMGFSGAIMPGPLLTVTINESLRKGWLAGPLLILGHAILELSLVVLIFFGLGTFITWPVVKGSIGLIGGLFLLWMAYGIMKEVINKNLTFTLEGGQGKAKMHPLVAGITVSASNPYWSLWWATVGAGALLLAGEKGLLGIVAFYSGHIFADFIWYSAVSTAVARGRKLFTPLIYRVILGVCGLLLCWLAVYFVYSGITFFLKP